MLCTALGWWCRHTIVDTLQDYALAHTFMTTQPAQFMFAFSVCIVILGVAQVLYVLWDCLGVRMSVGTRVPCEAVYWNPSTSTRVPYCATKAHAYIFWRSPSHGAQPLGLSSSHQSSHQCAQARPAQPPPPKLAQ